MLKWFFHDQLQLGLAQSAVAALVAMVVVPLARRGQQGVAQRQGARQSA